MGKVSEVLYKMRPYILMVCLQFGLAGTYIISMITLNHGMNRYVLIVYRNAIAALFLAPFALVLERNIRPKMTFPVFLQIMALGCLEPILDQGFSYLGMQYTSASFTSAITNAVPSVTFVIAVLLRLERIKIKEIRSQAKIVGTVATLGGALLMTLYKGPVINLFSLTLTTHRSYSAHHSNSDNKHWLVGTVLILVGCVSWSVFYILQSKTIKKYPAEISLSSLICLAGAVQSLAIALVVAHHPSEWTVGWDTRLLASVYTGMISSSGGFTWGHVGSGVTYYVQGVVMKTRGPVFVTAFNPLCMIIVAALGPIILAEKLYLGSIIGGIIIAIGLYSVVWGKSKDYSSSQVQSISEKGSAAQQELPITTPNIDNHHQPNGK